MLKAIEFTRDNFEKNEDFNYFGELTNNTIVLCNNPNIMDILANEIINTINGVITYNNFDCDDDDIGNAKLELCFGLQRLISLNDQHITLSIEPAIIYKAINIEDIWFLDTNNNGELSIYPMEIFKGSHQVWESGKDEVYKTICNAKYGTYDGNWVK